MEKLIIEWRHFDKEGKTCARCSGTGSNIERVIEEMKKDLADKGVDIELKEVKLTEEKMSESNKIIIDGTPLEELIPNTKVGENDCPSCAELIDGPKDCHCRTILQEDSTLEEIPVEMIKSAILNKLNSKN